MPLSTQNLGAVLLGAVNELACAPKWGVLVGFAENLVVHQYFSSTGSPWSLFFGVPVGGVQRKIKLRHGDCVFFPTMRLAPQAGRNLQGPCPRKVPHSLSCEKDSRTSLCLVGAGESPGEWHWFSPLEKSWQMNFQVNVSPLSFNPRSLGR